MGQCFPVPIILVEVDELFSTFESLSVQTQQALTETVHEVDLLAQESEEWKNRSEWWSAYKAVNGGSGFTLNRFFRDWIFYNPVPDEGEPVVLPSDDFPTGIPNGPGYYIEKWDWLVNTTSGLALNGFDTEFRDWFVRFLDVRGRYLKTPQSKKSVPQWIPYQGTDQHPFDINDYIIPRGGFQSFNEFFLRYIKDGLRTVRPQDASDDCAVVSPSDGGIFYLATSSDLKAKYPLPHKSNDKFNLEEAFPGYGSFFVGGPLLNTLLWFTDFHHFFSPVEGTIVSMNVFPGSYNYDFEDFDPYHPNTPKPPSDSDKVGWYAQLGKHKRFVWIIKTKSLGFVGMAAIGFWGVGSIVVEDKDETTWPMGKVPVNIGDTVTKGQYFGHFGYGGSSIVLAFQPEVDGKTISYDLRAINSNGESTPIRDANYPIQVDAMQHIVRGTVPF